MQPENTAVAGRMETKNIVCAMNLGEVSANTLAAAASLADTHSAHLTVVHVLEAAWLNCQWPIAGMPTLPPSWVDLILDERCMYDILRSTTRQIVPPRVATTLRIVRGECIRSVVALVQEVQADLLVIGAQRRHPLLQYIPTLSIVRQFIDGVGCPVLVVPYGTSRTLYARRTGGTMDQGSRPVDGSPAE